MANPSGKIIFTCGASQSGKTYWTMEQLKRFDRVIVWDIKNDPKEFKGFVKCQDKMKLVELCSRSKTGPLKIAYHGRKGDFDFFCKLAFQWAKDKPCAILVDELSDVTTIAKAPEAWGDIVRKILFTGSWVFAISQRPAECDKTVIGNASVIHVHRMSRSKDRKYIAEEMDISREMVDKLKNRDWVEKDMQTLKVSNFVYS